MHNDGADEAKPSVARIRDVGFMARLQDLIEATPEGGRPVTIMVIRLSELDEISVTIGLGVTMAVIDAVLQRIRELLPPRALVGKAYGDLLAVAVPDSSAAEAVRLASRVVDMLHEPIVIDGIPVIAGARIGLAQYPAHGSRAEEVLSAASIAQHTAHRERLLHHVVTERDFHAQAQVRLILTEFHRAIEEDELVLWYQPKVVIETGECVGVEALVRWNHPQRGLLPPNEFLPAVERTGLMHKMTLGVIDMALAQLRQWRGRGIGLPVAVNLSANDLGRPELAATINAMTAFQGLQPGSIEFEITETALMTNVDDAVSLIGNLRNFGYRVAIDDFGTGHSSLAYLKDLPVSGLKLDRSFISDLASDKGVRNVLQPFVNMAKNLGMISIAEGVENRETARVLGRMGCMLAQGYYYARPMPGPDFETWLARHTKPAVA